MKRCPECNGSGFIIKKNDETGEEEGFPCQCRLDRQEKDIIRTGLISAHIPPKFWEYTFDNYLSLLSGSKKSKSLNEKSKDKFKMLLDDPEKFMKNKEYNVLWIWGIAEQAGHTSLAVIFATELIKRNYSVRYVTMQSLLAAFTDFDKKTEFFRELNSFKVYLLDDAFDPKRCTVKGEYTIVNFYNWLSDSILAGKKFICTSKISINEIDVQFTQSRKLINNNAYQIEFKDSLIIEKKEFI